MTTRYTRYFLIIAFALFTLNTFAYGQDRPIVVIDPGHGGEDDGVAIDDWLEKDLILEMSFIIGAEFVKAGYDVIYTRTGDTPVAWDLRRKIAEDANAELLLMLHANRDEDPNKHGAEVYLDLENEQSKKLADHIAEAFTNMGSDVLIEGKPWPFLKSTSVPTAMIEVAFMTHPVERRLLKSMQFHHEVGQAFVTAAKAFKRGM